MAVNISNPIPLPPSVARRFYEVVIFLYCLTAVNFKNNGTREPDLETATGKSPKHEFFCFVNKLAQICDSQPGGDTITAIAVLQPGSIQYRFASNNRDAMSLEMVKRYLTDILNTLGQTANSELDNIYQDILGKVVAFNMARIEIYIGGLMKHFDFCIATCESGDTPEGTFLTLHLPIRSVHTPFTHPCDTIITHAYFFGPIAEKATAKLKGLQRLATSAAKETLSEHECKIPPASHFHFTKSPLVPIINKTSHSPI